MYENNIIFKNSIKTNKFKATFYILSFYYLLFFYIIPLYKTSESGLINYAGIYRTFNESDVKFNLICLFLFIAGFLFFDITGYRFSFLESIKNKDGNYESKKPSKIFWYCLLSFFAYLIVLSLDENRVTASYESRSGQQNGYVRILFLLANIFGGIKILLILTCLRLERKFLAILIITSSSIVEFYGAIGRFSLLINLLILSIIVFKLNPIKLSLFILTSTFLFLPAIVNLKSIIYLITFQGFTSDIIDYVTYKVTADDIIFNFGHPLASLTIAPDFIKSNGYSYLYDYIQGFLTYLRVFGLNTGDTITYAVTEYFIGTRISMIPPGYLAFGYIQLAYPGVLIAGITYRITGVIAEAAHLQASPNNNNTSIFLFSLLSANTFYHGEISVMILSFFAPMLFVLFFSKYFYTKKLQKLEGN